MAWDNKRDLDRLIRQDALLRQYQFVLPPGYKADVQYSMERDAHICRIADMSSGEEMQGLASGEKDISRMLAQMLAEMQQGKAQQDRENEQRDEQEQKSKQKKGNNKAESESNEDWLAKLIKDLTVIFNNAGYV